MRTNQHILVVADENAIGDELDHTVRGFARDPAARVHVVMPAPSWRDAPEDRLQSCLDGLAALGLPAEGNVGVENPIQAIADALAFFPATELVVAADPDLRDAALARFGLPTVAAARPRVAA